MDIVQMFSLSFISLFFLPSLGLWLMVDIDSDKSSLDMSYLTQADIDSDTVSNHHHHHHHRIFYYVQFKCR